MNDFYILLAQFFSTCLLQYFYICLGKQYFGKFLPIN